MTLAGQILPRSFHPALAFSPKAKLSIPFGRPVMRQEERRAPIPTKIVKVHSKSRKAFGITKLGQAVLSFESNLKIPSMLCFCRQSQMHHQMMEKDNYPRQHLLVWIN